MEFIVSDPSFATDKSAQHIWQRLKDDIGHIEGICYYKHPAIRSFTNSIPDVTVLALNYEPLAIKCLPYGLEDIEDIKDDFWSINGKQSESPLYDLDDYRVGLQYEFDHERTLRNKYKAMSNIALALISKTEFEKKFGSAESYPDFVWADSNFKDVLKKINSSLAEREWRLAKSVFQGVSPINADVNKIPEKAKTKGDAIMMLERNIALLDDEQHKVAVQIAPGPQRIRGLAGTGKTVVLAMKAANIHLRYRDKKILFTFHTQSLYNQTKLLISKFYRKHSLVDPDWENFLHIKHAWGGINRPGVYYDTCKMHRSQPLKLGDAKTIDRTFPFRACCKQLLGLDIKPQYDFILIDEAQDFPNEFFQLMYKLANDGKCIYWAYDELQNLSSVDILNVRDQFGVNEKSDPLISLDGEYPGGIEKDFVLHKSYRCALEILMLAHAIGLGIHSPRGCVQMLDNKTSWTALGYSIQEGNLKVGEDTIIYRPAENSPNIIETVYEGEDKTIIIKDFQNRNDELIWVAESIKEDIINDSVRPDHIVVVSLDSRSAKGYLQIIQSLLRKNNISSTIPGLIDYSWEFAEPSMVTLSTVYRAKGNEAPIVYIISFDTLYDYIEEIENRNRAFTSISRSKGWVRISGSGNKMKEVKKEIEMILSDIPYFKFVFPDMQKIRRLDASETSRRRKEVKKAKDIMQTILDLDEEALSSIDPNLVSEALKKLGIKKQNED